MASRPLPWILLLAALAWVGVPGPSRAGWIEELPDRTVIHIVVHDWIFPDPSQPSTAIRSEAAKVKAFTEHFPELFSERHRDRYQARPDVYGRRNWDRVEVRAHAFSGLRVEGIEADLLAIAGGVAPDVIYVNFRKSGAYIEQGFLYPLDRPEDGYVAAMDDGELAFRVPENVWPAIRRKGPDGQRHVWALPFGGTLGRVLLYRKDLFDAAQVPHPTPDWTWNELLDAARRISDPARGIHGIAFERGKNEPRHWMHFLWSAGGEAMVHDEADDTWRIVFDSREAATALDFYTRLCTEPWTDAGGRRRYGYAKKDAGTYWTDWERGRIGMKFDYMFENLFSDINPELTGMAPVPIGPTGLRAGELNSKMMGLYAGIADPAVRDAAWEFIRFYESQEAARVKTRVMVEGGLGRFVHPRLLEQFGYPELVRLAPAGWKETFDLAIQSGRPEPYGPRSHIAYEAMAGPIEEAERLARQGLLPSDPEQRLDRLQALLADGAARARRHLLDELPPSERQRRRGSAALFLLATVLAFAVVLRGAARSFAPAHHPPRDTPQAHWRRYRWGYAMLLPAVLTIALWQYLPMLRGAVIAFQDYRIMGGSRWVGLDNFGRVLWDPAWWTSVWNALRYSALVITLTLLPPVALAILLQEVPRGTILFRTIFYLPAVLTGLVVTLLWRSFYGDSESDLLNALLLRVPSGGFVLLGLLLFAIPSFFALRLWRHGSRTAALLCLAAAAAMLYTCLDFARPMLAAEGVPLFRRLLLTLPEPVHWLGDPRSAMIACVVPMAWAGMGPGCLIYLAALRGISEDLYEAADLDGASFTDKILFIVLPALKPLLVINFVGVFIASWFHAEANILAMTGGAAGTEVAGLKIFYEAFMFLQFGPATAMAWILAFLVVGFTVQQLRVLARVEFKAAGDSKVPSGK